MGVGIEVTVWLSYGTLMVLIKRCHQFHDDVIIVLLPVVSLLCDVNHVTLELTRILHLTQIFNISSLNRNANLPHCEPSSLIFIYDV